MPGILRWMGTNAKAFADDTEDPTPGLTQYATLGVNQFNALLQNGLELIKMFITSFVYKRSLYRLSHAGNAPSQA